LPVPGIKNIHVLLFLMLAGFVMYAPVLNTSFFSDDFLVLSRLMKADFNAVIFFRPLSDLSIYADHLLWKNSAPGFHVSSLLIHIGTAFLVYLVSTEFFLLAGLPENTNKTTAAAAALFFLVYPFHNETVVWIVGRGILLATAFSLVSMFFYLRARNRISYLLLSALFYFMALFGYESPLPLPLIILLIELLLKKNYRSWWMVTSLLLGALLLHLLTRYCFLGSFSGKDVYFRLNTSLPELLLNVCRLVYRSVLPPMQHTAMAMLTLVVIITACLVFYFKTAKRVVFQRAVITTVLMYLAALLPLVTVGIDTHDAEGGRFLYFPSVFFIWMIICFFQTACVTLSARKVALTLVYVYFGCFLAIGNRHWVHASGIIKRILNNPAAVQTNGKLYIIDMPDNLNGAYIFRNGFRQAFEITGQPLKAQEVIVLSFLHLQKPADPAPVMAFNTSYPGTGFQVKRDEAASGILITDVLNGKLYKAGRQDKVVYFSNGLFQQIKL
jgi:hypothetical protein